MCPFSPPSSSMRGRTPTQPVYISSATKAIHRNFPAPNIPSGHYQENDLFFLSLSPVTSSPPSCDLNTDNPSSNKYTHLFFVSPPPIPSIHTGMDDNPPERNTKVSETEADKCASRKQNRRNPLLTCSSRVDGQQELFPPDLTLSSPHFSSPPTFSTLFLSLPLGAYLPSTDSFTHFFPFSSLLSSPLHFTLPLCLFFALLWFSVVFLSVLEFFATFVLFISFPSSASSDHFSPFPPSLSGLSYFTSSLHHPPPSRCCMDTHTHTDTHRVLFRLLPSLRLTQGLSSPLPFLFKCNNAQRDLMMVSVHQPGCALSVCVCYMYTQTPSLWNCLVSLYMITIKQINLWTL